MTGALIVSCWIVGARTGLATGTCPEGHNGLAEFDFGPVGGIVAPFVAVAGGGAADGGETASICFATHSYGFGCCEAAGHKLPTDASKTPTRAVTWIA
jgi:hypothetical protein